MKNDSSGTHSVQSGFLYEYALATLFTTPPGVIWTQRIALADEWVEFKLQLRSMERGSCPKFEDMVCNVLFWPSDDNFSAVEFFYKSEEGNLMAFQVRRQINEEKVLTVSAHEHFLEKVNLQHSTKVILHLVQTPVMAKSSSIKFIPSPGVEVLMPECRVVQATVTYTHELEKID